MRLSTKIIAAAVTASLALGAPAAFAQTSAQQNYSKPGGIIQTQLNNSPGQRSSQPNATTNVSTPAAPAAQTNAKASGKLPFTGLDIALVVAAGGVLLAMGLGIRRLSRSAEAA